MQFACLRWCARARGTSKRECSHREGPIVQTAQLSGRAEAWRITMPTFARQGKPSINYEMWGSLSSPKLLIISPSNTALPLLQPYLAGPGGFAKLDRSFHCLAFDHRGTGLSSMPDGSWPDPPTLRAYAEDTLALLESVSWTTAHVLAFSFGAAVMQEMMLIAHEQASGVRSYGTAGAKYSFRPKRVLFVCPAVDVDGTPSGSYPLHSLMELTDRDRAERTLLLADTRRDYTWLMSEEGQAAMQYVQNSDAKQQMQGGAFEGRMYQMEARKAHATLARLAAATGGTSALPPSSEPSSESSSSEGSKPLLSDGDDARQHAVAPIASVPAHGVRGTSGLCDGEVAIWGGVHDAITPPHATMRLHAALAGSQLIWFPTGHWPNLARDCKAEFSHATTSFLTGKGVPPEVYTSSSNAARAIPTEPQTPAFESGDCSCLGACLVM